jgi:NADP-dependent 3-hydroxy acid dehydrogenase YdfG
MGHTFPSDADKTKVYICGPITGISDYKERFDKADLLLKNKGYCPINPVKLGNGDTDPNQWQGNMKTAIVGMLQADAIYLLGGWSASKGAVIEFNLANQLGYTFLNKDGSING